MALFCPLPHRALIAVHGDDRVAFLQGLVTQDVTALSADNPLLYSALLTPQGKYLYDFFLWHEDDRILIDIDAQKRDELMQLLRKYKLRKEVTLTPLDSPVYQVFGCDDYNGIPDPRVSALGWRSRTKPDLPERGIDEWNALRLAHNVPDAGRDLRIGLSSPFEGNIDLHNGISFNKGCYMGQELVSRIHHRGLVKKRFPNL